MTPSKFRQSIVESFSALQGIGLTDWDKFPNQRSLLVHDEFKSVALDPISDYEDVYKTGLEYLHYNFLLSDYSYFQFSFDKVGGMECYRYAYYPNPYYYLDDRDDFIREMITEKEVFAIDEIYLQYLDESETSYIRPPIRYDYEPSSYTPGRHPAGHMHVGVFQGSRIAVRRLFKPLTFALFIVKNFYPGYWAKNEIEEDENGFINLLDIKLAESKNDSKLIHKDYFTGVDEKLPYLD